MPFGGGDKQWGSPYSPGMIQYVCECGVLTLRGQSFYGGVQGSQQVSYDINMAVLGGDKQWGYPRV